MTAAIHHRHQRPARQCLALRQVPAGVGAVAENSPTSLLIYITAELLTHAFRPLTRTYIHTYSVHLPTSNTHLHVYPQGLVLGIGFGVNTEWKYPLTQYATMFLLNFVFISIYIKLNH